jgi:hypothetical protein
MATQNVPQDLKNLYFPDNPTTPTQTEDQVTSNILKPVWGKFSIYISLTGDEIGTERELDPKYTSLKNSIRLYNEKLYPVTLLDLLTDNKIITGDNPNARIYGLVSLDNIKFEEALLKLQNKKKEDDKKKAKKLEELKSQKIDNKIIITYLEKYPELGWTHVELKDDPPAAAAADDPPLYREGEPITACHIIKGQTYKVLERPVLDVPDDIPGIWKLIFGDKSWNSYTPDMDKYIDYLSSGSLQITKKSWLGIKTAWTRFRNFFPGDNVDLPTGPNYGDEFELGERNTKILDIKNGFAVINDEGFMALVDTELLPDAPPAAPAATATATAAAAPAAAPGPPTKVSQIKDEPTKTLQYCDKYKLARKLDWEKDKEVDRKELERRIQGKKVTEELDKEKKKEEDENKAAATAVAQERLNKLDAEALEAQKREKIRLEEAQTQSQTPATDTPPVVSQPVSTVQEPGQNISNDVQPSQDQSQEPVSTEKHNFFDETPVQPEQPEQPEQPIISEQPVTSEQPEQPEQPEPKTSYLHGTIKLPGSLRKDFKKSFIDSFSSIVGVAADKIKILRIIHGSIIVDYEISGDENELKTLKTKISLLPQNSIVVDGIISEEITEPKIDDVTGEEESVEQPKEEPVDYSQWTDYDVDLFAENEITITEKELDELIVEKIKQEYKIKILKDQLTKYVELDPEKLIHENGEYRHTVKELEQKLFDIAEDKTINSKNSFKGATDLKKMNAKLIDYIKNMRKEVDGIDFDLIDDLLIENRSVVEKVNKSDKKKKTMKGSKKVTFY